MIGKQISHYKIVEKLGEGGMGVVYRAQDTKLKREVALKFLPAQAVSSADDRRRFELEAQSAAALDHPNVCPVYEINETDGQLYIAMAFIEGRTLKERIEQDGPMDVLPALNVAIQVADGLAAAHRKGIVHRDIKSANIMLDERGLVRVMDFGLAHHDENAVAGDTSTGGTVAYSSPEQLRAEEVDARVDLWSFGVTLYELLTGMMPFKGDYESAVIYSVLNEKPTAIRDLRPEIPEELADIIHKALEKKPEDRFASADEMAAALRELRNRIDPHTSKVRSPEPAAPTSWFGRLTERHVLLAAFAYLAAVFLVVKGVDIIADRMMLSPTLVHTVAVALLSLLPSVVLLAITRGPRARSARPAVVGVPANVALSAVLLMVMFSGKELGAVTEKVEVTDEEGKTIERVIPKGSFRKSFALSLFDDVDGDSSTAWLQYAVPMLLEYDLHQDSFVQALSAFHPGAFKRLQEQGFDSWLGAPLSLKRKIASEFHMDNTVTGTVAKNGANYVINAQMHNSRSGKLVAEHTVEGSDVLALIDELSVELKHSAGVPDWHLDGAPDVAVQEMMSNSVDAVKEHALAQKSIAFDKDYEEGLHHLERAVAIDSTMATAYFDMYLFYRLSNRGEDSQKALDACLRHDYKLPERIRFIVRANYYYGKQQPEKAYALVKMMVELYPDDPQGYRALGQVHQLRGEYREAIEAYKRILELDPYRSEYLLSIARTYTTLGEYQNALEYLETYAKKHPDNSDSYKQLGDLYEKTADFKQARKNYEKALLMDPNRVGLMIDAARVEERLGNFDAALEQYQQALAQSISNEDRMAAMKALEDYYYSRGETVKAIEQARARFALGDEFMAPAIAMLQRLDNLYLYLDSGRLGELRDLLNRMETALDAPFDKALPFGYFVLNYGEKDVEGAQKSLEGVGEYIESLKLEMIRPQYWMLAGLLNNLRGDYDAAIDACNKALEMAPGTDDAELKLGEYYRKAGAYEDAEEHLTAVTRRNPSSGKAHYQLALLYHERGMQSKAVEHLETALSIWENADDEFRPAADARATAAEWEIAASM